MKYADLMPSARWRIIPTVLVAAVLAVPAAAQDFVAGEPIGALSEAGEWRPMSDNVAVYGSFHFSESCTFDPDKNLILAMNAGNRVEPDDSDGYVLSHQSRWKCAYAQVDRRYEGWLGTP